MKIKIALLGLLFGNSIIHPMFADAYRGHDRVDDLVMMSEKDDESNAKNKDKPEHSIKWSASVKMSPSMLWQGEEWSTKNSPGAGLTFKAEVPKACCNKPASLHIATSWGGGKELGISQAAVTIAKMVTLGYTSSIFGYEKADSVLLISPNAKALQIKYEYAFDWFRLSCAIENPVPLEVGWFDKTKKQYDSKADKDGPLFNRLDNPKNKERAFKIRNSFPAIGLNLGVVTDDLHIALSGLGRYTDYTHSTDSKAKKIPIKSNLSYGGHLGMQCSVVPKKFTVTAQGAYVHGLGDYLSGLSAIQKDDDRQEMCAVYYADRDKPALSYIDAWGLGGTLAYCATPEWTVSIRGSYLTTLKDEQKPGIAFFFQWNVVPKVAYQVNKYLTISSEYALGQESRIDEKENKKPVQKLSGSINFSL